MAEVNAELVGEILKLLKAPVDPKKEAAFKAFLGEEGPAATAAAMVQNAESLMRNWNIKQKVEALKGQPLKVLNATVGKPYETRLDFKATDWEGITDLRFEGLGEHGLYWDAERGLITGVPTGPGDVKVKLLFKVEGEAADAPFHERSFLLIINPDPKSLWKDLPSDTADPYWKEDNVTTFAPLGDRHILASSKRGRAHANVGSFREDHFAFRSLEGGWNIVVVSDGAGSAKVSRKGSQMACNGLVEHFAQRGSVEERAQFDELLNAKGSGGEDTHKKINLFVYNHLGKAVFAVHKSLDAFAKEVGISLKDLNCTLVFTLFKKYESGYALLSFGVGDCPMAVIYRDLSEVELLNWLDVGEFGGGTRFITMPEIFSSDKFATRFNFKLVPDFGYLMLMSDGIYDPKFVVEAALPDVKRWKAFFEDLGGKNEDGVGVDLRPDNSDKEAQLSRWMDFWSPGNHDDRTLVLVF